MVVQVATDFLPFPLTEDQRAALKTLQRDRCAICGDKPDQLVVDHDHDTGVVRGLLCNACNTGIGMLGDNPQILRLARSYLLRFKPDPDRFVFGLDDMVWTRPRQSLCPGSDAPAINLGSGLLKCSVCDHTRLKFRRVFQRKGQYIYAPKGHYRDALRPRGPGTSPVSASARSGY